MTSIASSASYPQASLRRESRVTPVFAALRNLSTEIAMLATVAACIGLFAISPLTLEAFHIPYLTSGGGFFSKFHPATFVAAVALGLRCLATPRPIRTARLLFGGDRGILFLGLSVIITCLYAVLISKTPVTPLVDTFVLPILVFLLLRDLNPTIIRWIALLLILLLCANAIMAVIETLTEQRFIKIDVPEGVTADPTRPDATFSWQAEFAPVWRATALLGHPLVNALITGAFVLCLLAAGSRWLPVLPKALLIAFAGISMAAFGGRAALALTFLFGLQLVAGATTEAIVRGARIRPKHCGFGLLALALLVAAFGVIAASGLFDNTLDRFGSDAGSANTRLTMFDLLTPISWTDLILGPNPEVVATLQRINGLEYGIESSWIGLALTYGLVVTSIIMFGLVAFSRSVIKASGRGAATVLLYYFLLVSVAASMSGKTTTLAMVVVLILVFLRKDESRWTLVSGRPARSAMRR